MDFRRLPGYRLFCRRLLASPLHINQSEVCGDLYRNARNRPIHPLAAPIRTADPLFYSIRVNLEMHARRAIERAPIDTPSLSQFNSFALSVRHNLCPTTIRSQNERP